MSGDDDLTGTDPAPASPAASRGRWAYLLLPALGVLTLVFLLPMINLGAKSFHLSVGAGREAAEYTLRNYVAFFSDSLYWELLGWTSVLGALVTLCTLALALPLSYFLARTRSRWRSVFLLLVVAPMLISVVIRNLGWLPILGEHGLVNWLLLSAGAVRDPVHLINNLLGVMIGLVHALLPFMILTLTAVIQRIAPELEEASVSLGARPIATFWRIVLPLALPGIVAGCLLVFSLSISAYTTPALMGGGRVIVMATYIQQQVSTLLDYAKGATVSMILLVWVSALSIVALRFGKSGAET
ncbi:MAG TPA: ABC transporter permease [Stellaceae bacterium]|nr:ABC transporter permease [Stellaceae bacterium]